MGLWDISLLCGHLGRGTFKEIWRKGEWEREKDSVYCLGLGSGPWRWSQGLAFRFPSEKQRFSPASPAYPK